MKKFISLAVIYGLSLSQVMAETIPYNNRHDFVSSTCSSFVKDVSVKSFEKEGVCVIERTDFTKIDFSTISILEGNNFNDYFFGFTKNGKIAMMVNPNDYELLSERSSMWEIISCIAGCAAVAITVGEKIMNHREKVQKRNELKAEREKIEHELYGKSHTMDEIVNMSKQIEEIKKREKDLN